MPYVDAQWVSEGFAGYYQNVMLARGGVYTEERAWQRLVRAFNRGADVPNAPSPNDTSKRPFWEVRMMLYWSAAALALGAPPPYAPAEAPPPYELDVDMYVRAVASGQSKGREV